MNPDLPDTPSERVEAQLTALLLGELSAEDAAALRKQMGEDPALAQLHDSLAQALELTREAVTHPAQEGATPSLPLRLSDQRRHQLLQTFKTAVPPQFVTPP